MSRRTERIAEQIQSEVAKLLRAETTDPRIGLVTITRVDVAPDLSHALVFWSALASDDPAERRAHRSRPRRARRPSCGGGSRKSCRCGGCPSCASASTPRSRWAARRCAC